MQENSKNYWLIKYAARRKSWLDILVAGSFILRGVRNPQARNYLLSMKEGDLVFHYQSQENQQLVGILKVMKEAFPDPTSHDPRWVSVLFAPIKTFKTPITLETLKTIPECSELLLFRQPRVGVMPVPQKTFDKLSRVAIN